PPEDQSDQIAVAAYLTSLQDYQDETTRIQDGFRAEMDLYQAKADVYKAEVTEYQKERATWEIDRFAAISGAEGILETMLEDFGWTYVNKDDSAAFFSHIISTWIAQIALITIMVGLILVLIKRKDAK
ncbi:MAG TPA: hypothetical protein DEH25_08365, partial [Chloroflexi bacterium]|nr:hypothetical protein [Chloroflexota bacterium]